MTAHAYIRFDPDTLAYIKTEMKTPEGVYTWQTGSVIRDWFEMVQLAKAMNTILIMGGGLNDFLFDVPGYRTVEHELGGEYVVADERDGEVSPRDADWTNGLSNDWMPTTIGSDGWAVAWKKDNRYAWRAINPRTGPFWQTADLIEGRYWNHVGFATQEEAFAREIALDESA